MNSHKLLLFLQKAKDIDDISNEIIENSTNLCAFCDRCNHCLVGDKHLYWTDRKGYGGNRRHPASLYLPRVGCDGGHLFQDQSIASPVSDLCCNYSDDQIIGKHPERF